MVIQHWIPSPPSSVMMHLICPAVWMRSGTTPTTPSLASLPHLFLRPPSSPLSPSSISRLSIPLSLLLSLPPPPSLSPQSLLSFSSLSPSYSPSTPPSHLPFPYSIAYLLCDDAWQGRETERKEVWGWRWGRGWRLVILGCWKTSGGLQKYTFFLVYKNGTQNCMTLPSSSCRFMVQHDMNSRYFLCAVENIFQACIHSARRFLFNFYFYLCFQLLYNSILHYL